MMLGSLITLLIIGVFALFWLFFARCTDHQDQIASDLRTYTDQLRSLDKEIARGIVEKDEAAALRTEIQRRILTASRRDDKAKILSEHSRFLLPVCLFLALGISLGIYALIGSPSKPDLPLQVRLSNLDAASANRPTQVQAESVAIPNLPQPTNVDEQRIELVDRLRQALADRPNDVRGLRLLVQQEIRLGNYVAAREAQQAVVDVLGEGAAVEDLANLFDIMLYNADDYISPEAEAVLGRLRTLDPDLMLGQFYQGMVEIQSGRLDKAFVTWKPVAENSPQNAPWYQFVRGEMPALAAAAGVRYELPPEPATTRGPTADDIVAANDLTNQDRQSMIQGMVDGLSQRLANEGGTPDEWQQLIRALTVLGETNRARAILQEAQTKFSADTTIIVQFEKLANELDLD